MQNAALRIATGAHETPISSTYMTKLKYFQCAPIYNCWDPNSNNKHKTHNIRCTHWHCTKRLMKQTIFHNNNFTSDIKTEPDITPEETAVNTKNLHTKIVHEYLTTRNHNKITNSIAPDIHHWRNTIRGNTITSSTGKSRKIASLTNVSASYSTTNIFTSLSPLQNKRTHYTTSVWMS